MGAELRAIIFDFNGVILDDEPLHLELFRRVLHEEGLTLTDEEYRARYLGKADRGAFTAALMDLGQCAKATEPGYLEELIDRKANYYLAAIREQLSFFPGIPELIRETAQIYPLAIASGALRIEIELALQLGGLRDCFRVIVTPDDVSAGKPDPETYLTALSRLNETVSRRIMAAECLVVEDSVFGVEAARRAGMRCLAVTSSYDSAALSAADRVVPSLQGLELKKVWAEISAG